MTPRLKWKRSQQLSSSIKDKDNVSYPSSSSSSSSNALPPSPARKLNLSSLLTSYKQRTNQPALSVSCALTIPEILLLIAAFLNRPSLLSCVLVCKKWHNIFQPLLFHAIQPTDFDRPDFMTMFELYAHFASSLSWIQELPIASSIPKKNTWRRIFRRGLSTKPLLPTKKPFEQLKDCLSNSSTPALKSLSVRLQNQDPNLVLSLSASTVASLTISTRGYPARKPRMYVEDILRTYPHLIHLTLEGLYILTSYQAEHGSALNSSSPAHAYLPSIAASNAAGLIIPATAANTAASLSISSPVAQTLDEIIEEQTQVQEEEQEVGSSNLTSHWPQSFTAQVISEDGGDQNQSTGQAGQQYSKRDKGKAKVSKEVNRLCPSVQTLNLRLVDISQDGLLALSGLLPNLKNLLIEEFLVPDMMIKIYRWTWSTTFIRSLRDAFPHLRSIRLAFPFDNIKEDTIVEILRSFPLLTTVGFRNSFFGKRAMETLQTCCPYVECLDVSFGCAIRGFKGSLLRFLQSWPRLRELEADGVIFHLDEPMDDEVQRQPWACTKLEKLVCGFQGTESMIFQHLSQFPRLSSLTISSPSLTLSPIESTLARLERLTRMEYFWFSQLRQRPLDKATILWILRHWPHLKKLHLAGGAFEQKEDVKQWCRDAHRLSLLVEYDRM
ncbi:hypothetical protein BX616_001600 [Lobosporangium transversale]|nr:hypothetical protein BX616_001600 [Lobosporangium transversale]